MYCFKKTNTMNVTPPFFPPKNILHYPFYDQLLLIIVVINNEYVQYLHLLGTVLFIACIYEIAELLLLNIIIEFILFECHYCKQV